MDFLYIGMLRDLKGPDLFIDAFARTERLIGRPLSAMMIGDGPQKDEYERMMLERGLGRRIEMLPAMKARDAFSFARTVVVPSRAESMPYIVLEALAAGKPVIAARVGGISLKFWAPTTPRLQRRKMRSRWPGSCHVAAITEKGWAQRVMPEANTFKERFSTSTMTAAMLQLYRQLVPESATGKV